MGVSVRGTCGHPMEWYHQCDLYYRYTLAHIVYDCIHIMCVTHTHSSHGPFIYLIYIQNPHFRLFRYGGHHNIKM